MAVLVVLACLAGVSACSSGGHAAPLRTGSSATGSTPSQSLAATPARACAPATLGIRQGPRLSPVTGEHGLIIRVGSVSPQPCTVTGYPNVQFIDAADRPIPFTYVDGKGQYVTHNRPEPVMVGGRAVAYFLVAKYRCDTRTADTAAGMSVLLPNQGTTYSVPLRWAVGDIALCRGPSSPDPGDTIEISPFEPAADVLAG